MPPFLTPRQLECSVQLQEGSCTTHTLLSKGKQICEVPRENWLLPFPASSSATHQQSKKEVKLHLWILKAILAIQFSVKPPAFKS